MQLLFVCERDIDVMYLAYLLNVTKTFPYAHHFIRKCSVFHMYVTIAVCSAGQYHKV